MVRVGPEYWYQYIKILNVCLFVTEVGILGDRTTAVTHGLCACYTLYCMCVITSTDALKEQQLKRTQ